MTPKPKVHASRVGLVKSGLPLKPRRPIPQFDPPPRLAVDPGPPASVPAAVALPPEEYEAHMAALEARHAGADPGPAAGAACWACGAESPNKTRPDKIGWHCRPMPGNPGAVEIYCEKCYDRWGWPKVPGDAP